jgi:hypothetical protein
LIGIVLQRSFLTGTLALFGFVGLLVLGKLKSHRWHGMTWNPNAKQTALQAKV